VSTVIHLIFYRYFSFPKKNHYVSETFNSRHETVNINLESKPEWFFTKNPSGTVPVLEQGDKIVTESLLTSDYLDEAYPNNPLHPKDPYLKIKQRQLIDFIAQIIPHVIKILMGTPETIKDAMENFKLGYEKIEKYETFLVQSGKPYFRGDTPGMLDYMVFPFFYRLDTSKELFGSVAEFPRDKFPAITAWLQKIYKDPAVVACTPDMEHLKTFIKSFTSPTGKRNYDP
jgi:glutathione S-transferase